MQKKSPSRKSLSKILGSGHAKGWYLSLPDWLPPKRASTLVWKGRNLCMIWTSTSWGCSKKFKFLHVNGFDRRLCPQDAAHTSCIGHHFSQFWSSLACSLRRFSFSMRFPSSPSCNVCDSGIAWRHEPLWRQISHLSFFVVSVGAFVHTGTPAHLSTLGGWGCCWWHAGPPPVDFHNFLVVTPGRMVETLGFWLRDMSPSCETSGTTGQTRPMVKTLQ